MRTNKLIHLYEMAGDKSHSSFLMWTVSGFSHTWTETQTERVGEQAKELKHGRQGFEYATEKNGHVAFQAQRCCTFCWINLLKNWNYLHLQRIVLNHTPLIVIHKALRLILKPIVNGVHIHFNSLIGTERFVLQIFFTFPYCINIQQFFVFFHNSWTC